MKVPVHGVRLKELNVVVYSSELLQIFTFHMLSCPSHHCSSFKTFSVLTLVALKKSDGNCLVTVIFHPYISFDDNYAQNTKCLM